MIERRERERLKERYRAGGRDKRERDRYVWDIYKESERERHRALPYRVCALVENIRETSQTEKYSLKKG